MNKCCNRRRARATSILLPLICILGLFNLSVPLVIPLLKYNSIYSIHARSARLTSLSSKVPYVQPEDILLDRLVAQASFTAITTWNYKDEDGNVAKTSPLDSNTPKRTTAKADVLIRYISGQFAGKFGSRLRSVGSETRVVVREFSGGDLLRRRTLRPSRRRGGNSVKVNAFLCTSNDGYIADEVGGVDWIPGPSDPNEDYGYKEFIGKQDAVLMGRKTYDWYMSFDSTGNSWPLGDMPIFVLTNRKVMMPGRGRPVNGGSIEDVLKSVRDAVGPNELKNLYVDGGETIRQFMDAGLLSTLCLSRFLKVELGRGVPLLEKKGSDMLSAMKPAYKVYEGGLEQAMYDFDNEGGGDAKTSRGAREADYSGLGLGEKEIEITEYIWSQCRDPKEKRSGLGVLGNRGDGEVEGGIYNPNEIIMAPVGIIDTTVKIDPGAWTRAVKCPPPAQTGVIFLVYPLITRKQSGLPPSMRRSGYIDPWADRQSSERQRLQRRAAQAAASRASMGVFGSLFGGGGGSAMERGDLGKLPTLEERKRYMVEGVMRKSLEALGRLHKLDVAHRSLGADSIVMTSAKAEEDLRNFGAEVSSIYGRDPAALQIVFTDLGFAGKISESHTDAEFCSRASGYGLKLSGSSSIGLTGFAIAEDLHALGVVFLDVLFNGVLTTVGPAGGSGGGAGGVGERLYNLYVDVFEGKVEQLRDYCDAEPGWEEVVDVLDNVGGVGDGGLGEGWKMLGVMLGARERARDLANDRSTISVLTADGILGLPFFSKM